MGSDDTPFLAGFVIGALLAGSLAFFCTRTDYRKEAIDRGFAEYDAETGYWQWVGEDERIGAEETKDLLD